MVTTMERMKSRTETAGPVAGYVRLSAGDGDVGRQVATHKLAIERLAGDLVSRVDRWYVDVGSDGRGRRCSSCWRRRGLVPRVSTG